MNVLIAADKFKTTLSSKEIAARLSRELTRKKHRVTALAVSDGGEGFLDALLQAVPMKMVRVKASGPHGRRRSARLGIHRKIAFIESCEANGIQWVPARKLDPWKTTSAGIADLLQAAVRRGARKIYLGLGSSATCDAALPAAERFGWKFLDKNGRRLPPRPASLISVRKIVPPKKRFPVKIFGVCDVTNAPLNGMKVYAPQKGARRGDVVRLEAGMRNLLRVIKKHLKRDLRNLAGGGAAGGAGAGMAAFFGAKLLRGSGFVARELNLPGRIRRSDVVITGEGRFDEQSLMGKIPGEILKTSRRLKKKVFLVTGKKKIPPDVRRVIEAHFSVETVSGKANPGRNESRRALTRIGKMLAARIF